jgi:hypothetical protein
MCHPFARVHIDQAAARDLGRTPTTRAVGGPEHGDVSRLAFGHGQGIEVAPVLGGVLGNETGPPARYKAMLVVQYSET